MFPNRESPKKGKKQLKQRKQRQRFPQRAVSDKRKNLFIRLQESQEGQALWKLWTDRRKNAGRKHGHLDGFSEREFRKRRERARAEAILIVEYMMENDLIPKDSYAKEAIEAVVELVRMPEIHPRDRLAAAKTLLDFTMPKPAQTINQNIKTAEDFLDEIAKDAGIG